MDAFLTYPPVRRRLYFAAPCNPVNPDKDFIYYRGRFPISLARHFYGDRYVCVGDAAGPVRAFKGKGITSAIQTATWAAETVMRHGVSRQAFHHHYRTACRGIIQDIPYGQVMRRLAILGSRLGLVDMLIALAEHDSTLRRALFDAVSAHRDYRIIIADLLAPRELVRLTYSLARFSISHRLTSSWS